MAFSVLLVCTGNTCRSAMAEGILRSLLSELGHPAEGPDGVRVMSAGTAGLTGFPASDLARAVAESHGVDISGHLSRALTDDIVERADLILTMTRSHLDRVAAEWPEASSRTFLLSEFANGSDEDIADPMGGPRKAYGAAYDTIEEYLRLALPRILESAAEGSK
jgi:protein-tyrosine-phosphatase